MTDNSKISGQLWFEDNLDEVPIEKLVHYTAVEYFLTIQDEPSSDATNLEKVNRYLESFHHLCEVKDWEKAKIILSIQLDTPTQEELHIQLGTWGYYNEQINYCSKLLDKLDDITNTVCLNDIGNAYQSLSNLSKSLEFYEREL